MITALNAIQSILCLIIIIGVGFYLTKIGWFNDSTSNLFAKLVTNISLPPLMIWTVTNSFDKEMILGSSKGLIIAFASIIICFLLSFVIAKLVIPKDRQGTFQIMFSMSNTIFIGLPVNVALFGEKSIPYALLYYVANTTLFWTMGVFLLAKDGGADGKGIISLKTLKTIFSPPLVSFFIAVLLVLTEIRLPSFILDTSKYLGNLTTPLSLMFLGITAHSLDLKKINLSLDLVLLSIGRFIISPLLVFALAYFIPIPSLMFKVFVIQAAMPIMAQTAIMAKTYNADYEYATIMISATTAASLVVIPILMIILSGY